MLAVDAAASPVFPKIPFADFFTSSTLVAVVVLGVLLWLSKKATTGMQLVPHKAQNLFEFLVEGLYGRVEGIVGAKLAPKAFPLLATLFLFILVSNWFGLVPGVGTIGWGHTTGFLTIGTGAHDMTKPILRPPTGDLNMTIGLALTAFIVWLFITIKEIGVWGFVVHTFGPKGGLKGFMGFVVGLVFLFVGAIELVSIAMRPLTLSVRLYGNIYAGESVLHAMSTMMDGSAPWLSFLGSVALPIPFYFMELLVGLLQAMVFTLLSAVYIQLSTTHDDHGHEEGHGSHH
ncbi:F0F1 ATP synthase subunit A [Roseimicrobium sp. ORNL1]|uniref:F0F1 ATP synthase subunit A n=1 Tax=Roseimicrobium sp. ORNL1 TaxID=2711231 RepID=UPI0013E1A985|nr:F0F1 ATP synthase subunit A [Roseimicrobium sp. ORNL1]QIF05391.1 F0F1 ATP synthase subunit A [Roseimicrobium sp. ORNL1]